MNAKEYRRRWMEAEASADRYAKAADEWMQRAFRAEDRVVEVTIQLEDVKMHRAALEAKLESINAFVDKANEEFTKAAAEDAAMVEQFNG